MAMTIKARRQFTRTCEGRGQTVAAGAACKGGREARRRAVHCEWRAALEGTCAAVMNGLWIVVVAVAVAVAVVVVVAPGADAAKTPKQVSDYFTICKRNDPDLSGCVQRSMMEARASLAKGIPELKMPPIDPLFIPAMELREGQGNFELIFIMKNLTMRGLKDHTVPNAKVDLEKGHFVISMFTPRILCTAQYEMRGRLLSLPINGNGDSTLDFHNVSTVGTTKMKNVTRNGEKYFEVESLKWDISVGYAQSTFTNLFNGDKTLGDTTNKFLNENWKEAFDTYKHLPEEAFSQFFTNFINRFFEQFTIDELYPE